MVVIQVVATEYPPPLLLRRTRRSSFCEIHENASNAFTYGCNQTGDPASELQMQRLTVYVEHVRFFLVNNSGPHSRPAPKKRPTPAKRPAPTKRRAPAPRGGGSRKDLPQLQIFASIQASTREIEKEGSPKRKAWRGKPAKNSMAAVLQAKLKARSMRLRKRESSHEVKRAALASRKRVESARRSSFASSSSNDDW